MPPFEPQTWHVGSLDAAGWGRQPVAFCFLASWSGPCLDILPKIRTWAQAREKKQFGIVLVQTMEKNATAAAAWVEALKSIPGVQIAADPIVLPRRPEPTLLYKSWLEGTGSETVPRCLLVTSERKLGWVGHPADLSDEQFADFIRNRPIQPSPLPREASPHIAKPPPYIAMHEAIDDQKWTEALDACDDYSEALPPTLRHKATAWRSYILVLQSLQEGQVAVAHQWSESLLSEKITDVDTEVTVALAFLQLPSPGPNEIDKAEKFARRAFDRTRGRVWSSVEVVGRALYSQQKYEEAATFLETASQALQGESRIKAQKAAKLARSKEWPLPIEAK